VNVSEVNGLEPVGAENVILWVPRMSSEPLTWTVVTTAAMASRAEYLTVKDRDVFQSTGVYVLVGPNENEPGAMEIYIGEGDVVHTPIAAHLAKLDFWTELPPV
jgi:hypothetical protein